MRNVFGILCLIAAIASYQSFFGDKSGSKSGQSGAVSAAPPKAGNDTEVKALLDRGRAMDKQLADSTKPRAPGSKADFAVVSKAEYDAAYKGLLQILPDNAYYQDAQKIIASLDKRVAEGEDIARKAAEKAKVENVAGRKSFAASYERDLLRKGLSVTVTTEGDRSSTLKVKYVLVSKALPSKSAKITRF